MDIKFFILEDKKIVEVDFLHYKIWINKNSNIIARSKVAGYEVVTIFLGLTNQKGEGNIFKTLILRNDDLVGIERNYTTYQEAENGHREFIESILSQHN